MAYARKGELESEVYAWSDGSRFFCEDCELPGSEVTRLETDDRGELLRHLYLHLARGQHVPDPAIERLRREINRARTQTRLAAAGLPGQDDVHAVSLGKGLLVAIQDGSKPLLREAFTTWAAKQKLVTFIGTLDEGPHTFRAVFSYKYADQIRAWFAARGYDFPE